MTDHNYVIHFAIEAVLAALICILYRRGAAARRATIVLETEHGLVKKRFEAATAGLHFRLLQVEKRLRELLRGTATPETRLPGATQLSRGEMALLMKVRQISER